MNLRTTMSAVHGVRPWARFSRIVMRYGVDFGLRGTTDIQYRFIVEFCYPRVPAHPRGEIKIGG